MFDAVDGSFDALLVPDISGDRAFVDTESWSFIYLYL